MEKRDTAKSKEARHGVKPELARAFAAAEAAIAARKEEVRAAKKRLKAAKLELKKAKKARKQLRKKAKAVAKGGKVKPSRPATVEKVSKLVSPVRSASSIGEEEAAEN